MAASVPKPREHAFPKKKRPFFLKLLGPVTPLWVLRPSRIVQMVLTESLAARAVFTKTIKMLGWQAGAPKFGSTSFRKKTSFFLKFIGPVTPSWVLYPSEIMHMVSAESLLSILVFTRSIKMFGWQPVAPKSRGTIFRKKNVHFFELHRTSDNSMGSVSL